LYGNYIGNADNKQLKEPLLECTVQLSRGAKQVLMQTDSILLGKALTKWPCRKQGRDKNIMRDLRETGCEYVD